MGEGRCDPAAQQAFGAWGMGKGSSLVQSVDETPPPLDYLDNQTQNGRIEHDKHFVKPSYSLFFFPAACQYPSFSKIFFFFVRQIGR
jgi:hypothetical protein